MQLDEAGRAELKRNLAALAEGGLSGERVVGRDRRQPVRLGDRLLVARSGRRTGRSRGPQGRSTGLRRSHRRISRVSRHRVWHGHRAHRQRTHRVTGLGVSVLLSVQALRLAGRCDAYLLGAGLLVVLSGPIGVASMAAGYVVSTTPVMVCTSLR